MAPDSDPSPTPEQGQSPDPSDGPLLASHERFFALSPDLLFVCDFDGRLRLVNPAFERILGHVPETLVGEPFERLVHPDDREAARVELSRVISGATIAEFECRQVTRDGAYRWVSWTAAPFGDERLIYAAGRDVTRRKRAEAALVEAFGLENAILESAEFTIISTSADGTIQSFNVAAQRMLGWRADEMIGIQSLVKIHDAAEVETRARELTAELGRPIEPGIEVLLARARADRAEVREWTHVARDGRRIPVLLSLTAMRDPGGQVNGFLCIATDITARKKAEETLRKNEELFRTLASSLPIGVFRLDAKGNGQFANEPWLRMTGLTFEDGLGDGWVRALHPEDRDAVLAEWTRCVKGRLPLSQEYRYITPLGVVTWVHVRATAIRGPDGKLTGYVGSVEDITKRRRDDEQIRDREARMRAIVETSVDGIVTFDEAGAVETFNPSAERTFGYPAAEIIGASASLLLAEEQRARYLALLVERVRTGAAPTGRRVEVQGRRKDASLFPLEMAVSEVRLKGRRIFTAILRDISERKAVERAKSEFVSTVSHELRTPLTSIRGSLGLVAGGVVGEIPEEALELIRIAHANTERLTRLINDILDLEKIEAGKMELHLAELEPARLLASALESMKSIARDAHVQLTACIATVAPIRGDEDRLIQVLTNLISNAVKFSPEGGRVEVHVETAGKRRVRFRVTDRGAGIPEEKLPLLFGKFQQLDSSDSRKKGGTGLGLSICKAIVAQHGGEIGVQSKVGEGSTFWFEIPVTPHRILPEMAPSVETTASAARRRVLVVEDDADFAQLLDMIAQREGFSVVHACNIAAAEKRIAEALPDVVLLDVRLPDGDGLRILETLRARDPERRVPVVVVSGCARGESAYGSPLLFDWLQKPIDPGQISDALRRALRRPGAPRALIVEDDEGARRVIATELRRLGVQCVEAADGESAVAIAREGGLDLIVLDVSLPRGDGFDVVNALRREDAGSMPLIVYTGRDLTGADREALRLGLTRYLVKSRTSEEQFTATVRELLSGLIESGAKG